MASVLESLERPIVAAPMGGGPTTPELVRAVGGAGGFGFLAAGYKGADAVEAEMRAVGEGVRFGVNLFVPGPAAAPGMYESYVKRLGKEAGEPRWSDDAWAEKVKLLASEPVAVVSFTFGCPEREVLGRLHEAGSEVWLTVTNVAEAEQAVAVGADALVAQGYEAGAHQGTHDLEAEDEPFGLLALLQLLRAEVDLPLVASGGIGSGAGVAACLAAGASAVQLGTAFMLCPEAGTSAAHREALRQRRPTRLTRAFTGRRARGAVNRFLAEHEDAPPAYPEIHYATAPLRAAAREAGDAEALNLWAGQAHWLAREEPAATVVDRFTTEARSALDSALQAFPSP
ncbi:MAG TPA: nitronate monooxygenase [Solirubrobacterales bacterium]|nr:nitronate monooxygenase [Solirubrobacterales bacterium]